MSFVKKTPNEALVRKLASVPSASLATASICVMELRFGALKTERHPDLWMTIQERIISKVRVFEFGFNEALKAADILMALQSSGKQIGLEDVMIGSIGLANGLTVVTGNTRHFSRIPGLLVENWLQ